MLVFFLISFVLFVPYGQCLTATADLQWDGTTTSIGKLTFTQDDANSPVKITGTLSGLNASTTHGFHVHQYPIGDGVRNCTAAGAHYNPYNVAHGPITANISGRHVGDLGNLMSNANGVITVNIADSIIQLFSGIQSIVNRTIVLHADPDDNGMGNYTDSMTTGHAGARLACGTIYYYSNGSNIKANVFFASLIAIFMLFLH